MSTAPADTIDDRTPEWHAWRAQGIGGSDIAAICGLSSFGSPFSTYLVKRGEIDEPDLSESPAVEFGKRVEPIIPAWFHDRTGLYVVGEQTWCTHPDNPVHLCTADGFVAESPSSTLADALGPVEFKATRDSEKEWEEQVPTKYVLQGQWQCHVNEAERMWFAVIHRMSGAFRTYAMERDDTVIAELVRIADEFWQRVVDGNPPPADAHDATTAALKEAYPVGFDGDGVDLTADLIDRWQGAKADEKVAQSTVTAFENEIKALLGDESTGLVNGVVRATWKSQDRRAVDLDRLRTEFPEVAEAVTTTSSHRVLRHQKEKK